MEGAALHPGPALVQHCPEDPVQLHDPSTAVSCSFLFFLCNIWGVQRCDHSYRPFGDYIWVLSRQVGFQHLGIHVPEKPILCLLPHPFVDQQLLAAVPNYLTHSRGNYQCQEGIWGSQQCGVTHSSSWRRTRDQASYSSWKQLRFVTTLLC